SALDSFISLTNYCAAMRWRVDLDLLLARARPESVFRLFATGVVALVAVGFEEAKGETRPISPRNHTQSLAAAACVNAIAAINVMSSVFMALMSRWPALHRYCASGRFSGAPNEL